MELEHIKNNFTVALLIEDLNSAKEISNILREFGIFAQFFNRLDEFWLSINAEMPDMAIIDVALMSQDKLLLEDHPLVRERKLAYAFYFEEKNSILLKSTYHHQHCGYLRSGGETSKELRRILLRRIYDIALKEENKKLNDKNLYLIKRLKAVSDEIEKINNFEGDITEIQSFITQLEDQKYNADFSESVAQIFNDWKHCKKFTLYMLNNTGQKLISPQLTQHKYRMLPSLWLGKIASEGIERYALDMATEVSLDEMNPKDLKILKINGKHKSPDLLVVGEFDLSKLTTFPWQTLERELSNTYKSFLLNHTDFRVEGDKFIPFWDALSELDDTYFDNITSSKRVFQINFKNLFGVVSSKVSNRFYFKAFFTDFLCKLASLVGESKISVTSVFDVMVFVDNSELDVILPKLKNFTENYQYFKYFEDSSVIMTKNMFPTIKMIAHSSVNYLRNSFDSSFNNEEGLQIKKRERWQEHSIDA